MSKMSKFPSIDQFRSVIKQVQDNTQFIGKDEDDNPIYCRTIELPTLRFTGTTKIHGTNASIGFTFGCGDFWCQSREHIITPENDNAGFANYVEKYREEFINLTGDVEDDLVDTLDRHPEYYGAVIYGEWCGKGIQKGVGVNELPKMFVIFGIKLLAEEPHTNIWLSDNFVSEIENPDINVYNIFSFGTKTIDIDFNKPEEAQNLLIQYTQEVEAECPVAKYFGIENGVGEGLVWKCTTNDHYRFKTKGEKHSISKVKTLVPIDIERVNSINECVSNIVTENRLDQGLDHLRMNKLELDIKNTGEFIKWINLDIIKEETDTIIGSGLEVKEVTNAASKVSKKWFFDKIFS